MKVHPFGSLPGHSAGLQFSLSQKLNLSPVGTLCSVQTPFPSLRPRVHSSPHQLVSAVLVRHAPIHPVPHDTAPALVAFLEVPVPVSTTLERLPRMHDYACVPALETHARTRHLKPLFQFEEPESFVEGLHFVQLVAGFVARASPALPEELSMAKN